MSVPAHKACARCGRAIAWRKKWERCWGEIRWCSDACRRSRLSELDREIEQKLVALLVARGLSASVCPSEVARALAKDWEPLMEPVRMAARRMVARGEAEITQRGSVVDPSSAKGPIRVRLAR